MSIKVDDVPVGRFVIGHPGTGEPIKDLTFEQAMDKWFEGFNVPRMVEEGGKLEDITVSHQRVRAYYDNKHSKSE